MAEFSDLKVYGDIEVYGNIVSTQDVFFNGGYLHYNETDGKLYFYRQVSSNGWEMKPFMFGTGNTAVYEIIDVSGTIISGGTTTVTCQSSQALDTYDAVGIEWSNSNTTNGSREISWIKPSSGSAIISQVIANYSTYIKMAVMSVSARNYEVLCFGARAISMSATPSVDNDETYYVHKIHCLKKE